LKRAEGASVGGVFSLKPLRTDSVNRGLSISCLKLAIISRAFSIRLIFFMINTPL
jgi:hypothetical protein